MTGPRNLSVMRLNRFLARCGVASRRKSDQIIMAGTVRVNGQVVAEPGRSIDVHRDTVHLDDALVKLPRAFEYIMLNKPAGCLVTRSDTHGRETVFDRVNGLHPGTVTVGRLDQNTTGLLLLTDDGELAHRLMHPQFRVDKLYLVTVRGTPSNESLNRLRRGVQLDDGITAPAGIRLQRLKGSGHTGESRLEVCIREGRKRQVKRMVEAVGHPARSLQRVEFAGLKLNRLKPGEFRNLRLREISELRSQVGL